MGLEGGREIAASYTKHFPDRGSCSQGHMVPRQVGWMGDCGLRGEQATFSYHCGCHN